MKLTLGIVLVCDHNGNILKVLHNDLGIAEQELLRKPFPIIVTPTSFSKALSFLVELKAKQTVFDWELNLLINGKITLVHCAGLMLENDSLILVAQTRYAVHHLFEEMMYINNEQSTLLRTTTKEIVDLSSTETDREIEFYEDLSRLNNELINLQRELAKKNAELQRLNTEIQRLATTDELTKIYNRRGFFELAQREVNHAKRTEKPLAAIMMDIDFFKRVNDSYGHGAGDRVLAEIAARCSHQLRSIDIFGRCGGEEFMILLPETTLENAIITAERLRQNACQTQISTESDSLTVTISLGVAVFKNHMTLENLFGNADHALYQAKESGRNRVCVHPL